MCPIIGTTSQLLQKVNRSAVTVLAVHRQTGPGACASHPCFHPRRLCAPPIPPPAELIQPCNAGPLMQAHTHTYRCMQAWLINLAESGRCTSTARSRQSRQAPGILPRRRSVAGKRKGKMGCPAMRRCMHQKQRLSTTGQPALPRLQLGPRSSSSSWQ